MVFLLAILGMLCWGASPIFGKIGLANMNPMLGLIIRTYIAAILITLWVIFRGFSGQIQVVTMKEITFIAIEAILATLVGDWAYYAALKHGEVSFVTIVMACSPIVSIITAMLFLDEKMTIYRLAGTLMVIGGLSLVTLKY
jgi:transporter family protein